ncbi:MAG: sulfotransferase family protein [Phycisphaerales bacterium JB038]
MERADGLRFADFIVIGAQKAGTTSLFHYLNDHPQIYLHPKKELAYFARPEDQGKDHVYAEYFRRAPADAFLGDVSTQYSKYPFKSNVPERIAALVPKVRLIYLVRHPVKRVLSAYHHELLSGRDLAPIDEEVRSDPNYVDISSYHKQIEQYLPYFDREQLLIVPMEEMLADKATWVRRIFAHIGCDANHVPANLDTRSNVSDERVRITPLIHRIQNSPLYRKVRWRLPSGLKGRIVSLLGASPPPKPTMPEQTRLWLTEQLRGEAEALQKFMGRDEPLWDL